MFTNEDRDAYKKRINEVRHHLGTLEAALDGDPDPNVIIRHVARCRASVNAMLAHATRERTEAAGGDDAPAWKAAAEKLTG
jgi:hypothetical protein